MNFPDPISPMPRRCFSLALSFVLLAALPLRAQTFEQWCDRAASAIEHDSLPHAEHCILQALKLDPANPRNALLFSNLGTIQRRMHKYEDALQSFTLALNSAPLNTTILMNRAALYLEMGKEPEALVDYSNLLDRKPGNREALLMRAYIYGRKHDYKSAHADYDSLLKHSPQDFNGRLGLATLEQQAGKYEVALSILNEMIAEKVKGTSLVTAFEHAVTYIARAGVERDMKRNDSAFMDLQEAIRLDASRPEAYLMRGQIYLAQKEKEQARRDFEKAIVLGLPKAELQNLLDQCK